MAGNNIKGNCQNNFINQPHGAACGHWQRRPGRERGRRGRPVPRTCPRRGKPGGGGGGDGLSPRQACERVPYPPPPPPPHLNGNRGLRHRGGARSQFRKPKIFHKSKVTNRLCGVITLTEAAMLIDSYTHILSDYHNVFAWRNSGRAQKEASPHTAVRNGWPRLLPLASDFNPATPSRRAAKRVLAFWLSVTDMHADGRDHFGNRQPDPRTDMRK